jgi:ABC-2 type transport system permease protein
MTGAWALFKKDISSYFRSWVGVLVWFGFLFLSGIFFSLFVLSYSQLSMQAAKEAYAGVERLSVTGFVLGAFLLNLGILFLFMAPLLSMRSLAEEKKVGTLELLYTYPLSDFEIVLGKYLALLGQLLLLFLPTLAYVGVMKILGASIDLGIVLSGTFGFVLLGASFLALGLFFSSLTENQMLAGGLTFGALMILWVLEWFAGFLPPSLKNVVVDLTPFVHFRDFSLGILDLSDIVYFLSCIFFFCFLSLRVIETRNWKG